jgi:hypothetical protein
MRFLQEVKLPEKCLLNEVLLWVAFRRIPIAMISPEEGKEVRDAEEDMFTYGGYTGDLPDSGAYLEDCECASVGLPPDPRMVMHLGGGISMPGEGDEEFDRRMREWRPQYDAAIEYSASLIFIALKEGKLAASGKLLPDQIAEIALEFLEQRDQRICDLPTVAIPRQFWSLSGIDWKSNSARNGQQHYCWIRFKTDDMFMAFPAENRIPTAGVERIGVNYVLNEASDKSPGTARPRGRPAFAWDAFHWEVTDLLLRKELPEKKEAAIQHLQEWFAKSLNQRPGRSSIGEKLKPYYERFMKSTDRN